MNDQRYGIVGGLGALGAADIFFKLVKAAPNRIGAEQPEYIFEQQPFAEGEAPGAAGASQNGRKLYVFDMLRRFEARGLNGVILPCFISHTFIDELRAEIKLPIISLMDALRSAVARRYPEVKRIGVLTSDYVQSQRLFERHFTQQICYPKRGGVMPAIYGADGLKRGALSGASITQLALACEDLLAQGAELIVPGFTEISIASDALAEQGFPIIDANQAYAEYAVRHDARRASAKPFKIGVVGGVGPAATVDFMDKIVRNTPAERDRDHVKLVVEQNPQIPDRTANLIASGADPTIGLYATCKRLEAAEADIIAIPCNTAHAYVERIQPYLAIPVVNMLTATTEHIRQHLPPDSLVGLLATSGTVKSGIYHEAASKAGIPLLVPDEAHQEKVMAAIYGDRGVKAGFTDGECKRDLLAALDHLTKRGAQAVILGCTELPLVLGASAAILDPTDILAKKCVAEAVYSRRSMTTVLSSS